MSKTAQLLRRRILRLPLYFWTSLTVATLVGVAIGATLFSATFNASVNIRTATPNLTIIDIAAGRTLATNLVSNQALAEFGTTTAGNSVSREIRVWNSGGNLEPTFYIRIPGSTEATMLDGTALPDGITLAFLPGYTCASYSGTVDSTTQVCSIPIGPGGYNSLYLTLTIPNTATARDLTIKVTITAFDTQF